MTNRLPEGVRSLGDDVPKDHLFIQPLAVRLRAEPPEDLDGARVRVTFAARVLDAEDNSCPDLAVDARIDGPERHGVGMAHTDPLGEVLFRMEGPPGTYRCEIIDVAAGALDVRRDDEGRIAATETVVS